MNSVVIGITLGMAAYYTGYFRNHMTSDKPQLTARHV